MATQKIEWNEKLRSVRDKSFYTLDINIHKTITEREKYRKDFIENDSSLTENEKKFLLNDLQNIYDALRIGNNSVEKQQCDNCQNWHQAIQYCEFCIRKYLENDFGNWTSGNNEIDKLIQECQQKTTTPHKVIEWIEYDQFENVEHLAEGGCATIYTTIWKDGFYDKWDSERQILERLGRQKIVLKRLNNSNNNNVNWFQEVTLSVTLDNTSTFLVECYGLTKDPTTQDYITIYDTTYSLDRIHSQNIVHRDLHSGNILYNSRNSWWYIGDLGLSGPVDKPSNSIYGNLPYIAPEVICGEIYTKKSDIYSMGILMWEVITCETPFDDYEHDLELALDIVKGCRPKIYEYIPHEYVNLMKQCWDANPDNRPDTITIYRKMRSLIKSYNEMDKLQEPIIQSKNFKSKIQNFFKLKSKKDKNNQKNNKMKSLFNSHHIKLILHNKYLAFDSKQLEFEVSEEMEQQYLKSIGADNSNKSCDDQEYGIAGSSNSGS
ncbi:hypothetical protein Glove_856g12 [Diversispora epigaea]|uniref:Protein kinase domain-containing protein n=1 Tax=Diversispora epigaea TaxID=1348612 RepID=A0A397FYK9_9GLOM|nr:hypothetical protein Glove_856g12 [Diversispora epigaea]